MPRKTWYKHTEDFPLVSPSPCSQLIFPPESPAYTPSSRGSGLRDEDGLQLPSGLLAFSPALQATRAYYQHIFWEQASYFKQINSLADTVRPSLFFL